jgi:Uma2 family endonuclease
MIDARVFRDDAHVELLGGILVDKMVKHPPHNLAVGSLASLFRGILVGWLVNEEKPFDLNGRSRPEPDVAVINGRLRDYGRRNPTAAEIVIICEIADSSYAKDRGLKWRMYAAARIPEYWIVNLPRRQVEVYTDPTGRGKNAEYRTMKIAAENDEISVVLGGRELGRIKVCDVLPPLLGEM